MKLNGPDVMRIRARFSLLADMPKDLRALSDEVLRLRNALAVIESSEDFADAKRLRELAHIALYANEVQS